MIWVQVGIIVVFTALFATALVQGEVYANRGRRAGLWICLTSSTFLLVLTGFWLCGATVHGYYVALGYFGLEIGLIVVLFARILRRNKP